MLLYFREPLSLMTSTLFMESVIRTISSQEKGYKGGNKKKKDYYNVNIWSRLLIIVISSLRDTSFDVFVSRHIYAKALSTLKHKRKLSLWNIFLVSRLNWKFTLTCKRFPIYTTRQWCLMYSRIIPESKSSFWSLQSIEEWNHCYGFLKFILADEIPLNPTVFQLFIPFKYQELYKIVTFFFDSFVHISYQERSYALLSSGTVKSRQ